MLTIRLFQALLSWAAPFLDAGEHQDGNRDFWQLGNIPTDDVGQIGIPGKSYSRAESSEPAGPRQEKVKWYTVDFGGTSSWT